MLGMSIDRRSSRTILSENGQTADLGAVYKTACMFTTKRTNAVMHIPVPAIDITCTVTTHKQTPAQVVKSQRIVISVKRSGTRYYAWLEKVQDWRESENESTGGEARAIRRYTGV
jgi:hypothetical protein